MDNTHSPEPNPNDARAWAWMQSWDHLEAATKIQEKHGKHLDLVDPIVGRLQRSAEIYAQLASAADPVGLVAAEILVSRKEQADQQHRMMKNFLERAEDGA